MKSSPASAQTDRKPLSSKARGVLAAAALAPALLAGCSASKPVVTLHDAGIRSASLRGVGLDVFLKVDNPNSFDIEIRNVRAEVTIGKRYKLAPINIQPNQWLPAEEETIVRVPVVIPWQVVYPLIKQTLNTPTISYEVKGSTDVTAVRMLGIERDNYPIDESGSVRTQDLVNAASAVLR